MPMVNFASPPPKRKGNDAGMNEAPQAKTPKNEVPHAKSAEKQPKTPKNDAQEVKTPRSTRRARKLKESDWEWKEDERTFVLEPPRPDVHKYTLVYLHNASGNPKEYFESQELMTPGLKVVLPKAHVYRCFEGKGEKRPKCRLWYEYYHDAKDPTEDPSQGADAEELELDSDEEKEAEKKRLKALGTKVKDDEEEEEEKEEKPMKFSEFIKTVSPKDHPEMSMPKEAQVTKTLNRILSLIHREAAALGGDYSRILLGGWSQGATTALITAIHKDCPSLGGLLSVSGTFHADRVTAALKLAAKSTPFVLYVGIKDDTYPLMLLTPLVEKLRGIGYQIDLREKNMDHCLNGNIGAPDKIEERWIRQFLEATYQDSSVGSLMKDQPGTDAKDYEAALKVVYGLLFGDKAPHNRRAEIMKHSCYVTAPAEIEKRARKLSAEDLALAAKFFGASSATPEREDLARFLATPTAALLAALRGRQ